MTPSLPRLMAQLKSDPPVELWRRSRNDRELNATQFKCLTYGMTKLSGWRVWWERPLKDRHAVGRQYVLYAEYDKRPVEVVDDSDLEIEVLNISIAPPADRNDGPSGYNFGRKQFLRKQTVLLPSQAC